MRELVFEPLGMTDSAYVWLPEYETRKVYGHSAAGVVAERRRPAVATVATLHTTPLDYARFVIAIMNRRGLEPRTMEAMLAPQSAIDDSLSWGLGWGLERTARGTAFWHHGENNGEIQNFAIGYPDGSGVVVFTNSGNGFSILPEIVTAAVKGEHPAFAWMGYDSYRAPSKVLLRELLNRGASAALTESNVAALTEKQINSIGYALLARGRIADAISVLQTNVRRFPASANAYDSLAEACLTMLVKLRVP